jgi:oligopeptide transport system substrate-binding protein
MFTPRFALALILAGLCSCARRETPAQAATHTQTLLIGNYAEPRDLDPHVVTSNPEIAIVTSLLEGLTLTDPKDCHPIPGVAERWETAPDGLTWTFHLRANARWSNGNPVTARDFIYSWKRALSPAMAAEYATMLYCLKNGEAFHRGTVKDFSEVGARAPDDHTLVLTLKSPTPYLPSLVAMPVFLPVHQGTIEKFGRADQRATAWTKPGNYVGNGAFVLNEWSPNQRVRVTQSPTYWDREHVRLREAIFFPIDNTSSEEAAFRAGQLHVTSPYLPVDKAAAYRNDPQRKALLHEKPVLRTKFLRLNCRQPPLDDVRVRRALSLAIDRAQLVRSVLQCDTPAFALTPPDCAGYTAAETLKTDIAEAKRLLAAAGFPEGRGFPPLDIRFYQQGDSGQPVVEVVQQMWRKNLGIDVALASQEMRVVLDARKTGDYRILLAEWGGDYLDPTTFLDLLLSGSSNNGTGWASADYDGLLAQAANAQDPAQRHEILRKAETLMLNEAPFLPLFYYPSRELRHPAVRGWHSNLLDLHPVKFVWLEGK